MTEKANGPGYLDMHHRFDDMLHTLVTEFKTNQPLRWPVVSKRRIHQTWDDFSRLGYVRDERVLDAIFATMRDSVLCLHIATMVAGHTEVSPENILSDHLPTNQHETFADWLVDFNGAARLSDYGLTPLYDAMALAFEATTSAARLKYLDRALNVVHARGDLAKFLIEGGRATVVDLSMENDPPNSLGMSM